MMQYNSPSGGLIGTTQGVCPTGWHIPTDYEFKTLETYLGMSESEANQINWRGTDEGAGAGGAAGQGVECGVVAHRHQPG